jgi:hypothetical protein
MSDTGDDPTHGGLFGHGIGGAAGSVLTVGSGSNTITTTGGSYSQVWKTCCNPVCGNMSVVGSTCTVCGAFQPSENAGYLHSEDTLPLPLMSRRDYFLLEVTRMLFGGKGKIPCDEEAREIREFVDHLLEE